MACSVAGTVKFSAEEWIHFYRLTAGRDKCENGFNIRLNNSVRQKYDKSTYKQHFKYR